MSNKKEYTVVIRFKSIGNFRIRAKNKAEARQKIYEKMKKKTAYQMIDKADSFVEDSWVGYY